MDRQRNNHGGGGGFFFGLIVGAVLTLLFTTKKGRKILKVLTEEGFDKFGEWEDILKDVTSALDDDEALEEDVSDTDEEALEEGEEKNRETSGSRFKKSTKRFFRGVRRRTG